MIDMVANISSATENISAFAKAEAIAKAIAITIMIVLAAAGNLLVILSVCCFKKLRTFTNILLVSMATADFLIGLLIMPLAMLYTIHEMWPFGPLTCKVWLTLDVLLCTASILNLCVISIDRYFAILYPLRYLRQRTKELSICLIAGVWVLSSLICTPPWFVSSWGFSDEKNACEYVQVLSYRIYSALGSFYVPTFVILFVYYRILRVASSREKMGQCRSMDGKSNSIRSNILKDTCQKDKRSRLKGGVSGSLRSLGSDRSNQESEFRRATLFNSLRYHLSFEKRRTRSTRASPNSPGIEELTIYHETRLEDQCYIAQDSFSEISYQNEVTMGGAGHLSVPGNPGSMRSLDQPSLVTQARRYYHNSKPGLKRRVKTAYQRERKALKTIGVIVVGFIACWLPFFLLYLLQSTSPHLKVTPEIEQIFLWLGYSNSLLNPAIYTFYNLDFRRAFAELLSCGCLKPPTARRYSVRNLHTRVA